MCNEKFVAVQLGHSGLDRTILCILWDLGNFLTDNEIISWPEIWACSVGRQTLFAHSLWSWMEKAGVFKSHGES